MSGSNILFLVSGSIAAYKACEVVSQLVQHGNTVKVVMSAAAQRFVGPTTFEAITRQPVLVDLFESGRALDHTELTRWCDVTVLCPATANTLNRMAAGIGDDLVGAILLATDWSKPLLIAPAMNPRMWNHPATAHALRRVKGWGARIIEPDEGRTACGDVGEGRLAEPASVVAEIESACALPAVRKHVVITSGGTSEPIDRVRVLGNRSSGATGALIARRLGAAGHTVTLVRAKTAVSCPGVREILFESGDDLQHALERILGEGGIDAVVHAAAVGDFRVAGIETGSGASPPGSGKIESDSEPVLRLAPRPKLITRLRDMSPDPICLVGFKLTSEADEEGRALAARELLERSGADFVVHNDLDDLGVANEFPATIYSALGSQPIRCPTRTALADAICSLLSGSKHHTPEPATC